jgi:hypothetical protein
VPGHSLVRLAQSVATTICLTAILARGALGATIDVFPGPGTPLQDAIDAASPGDTLHVHLHKFNSPPDYPETIVIDKSLRVVGIKDFRYGAFKETPVVLAPCTSPATLTIAADNVSVTHLEFDQVGDLSETGSESVIDVQGRSHVAFTDAIGLGTCTTMNQVLNVVGTTRLKVNLGFFTGFTGLAGVRIAAIATGSHVRFRKVRSTDFAEDSATGAFLIEDVAPGAALGKSGVRLRTIFAEAATGVLLRSADGVGIDGMTTQSQLGIRLDGSSDHNFIQHSDLSDGAVDEGTGNCWRDNTPDLFGCP